MKNYLTQQRRLRKFVYFASYFNGGVEEWALFPFPPTSHEHQFYGLTSDFTRLIMKTKYVCHGLISLYVSFHDNRKM